MMDGLGSDFIGVIFRDGPQPGTSANSLADNFADNLWIGTSGGLSRLRDGRFTNLTIPPGVANNTVTAIAPAANGALWLGTNGSGLHHFGQGMRLAFPELGHLPARHHLLHAGRSRGTSLAERAHRHLPSHPARQGAGDRPAVAAYGTADGMNIRECSGGGHPAAWQLHDGTPVVCHPRRRERDRSPAHSGHGVPPPVVIETVLVDDHPRAIGEGADRFSPAPAAWNFTMPA